MVKKGALVVVVVVVVVLLRYINTLLLPFFCYKRQ